MSDLPPGWVWATLEELLAPEDRAITDGPFGSNLATRHYTTSGARVIRLQNIGDCTFNDERVYISLDHFARLAAHEARPGDLVIASLGQDLPKACIVPRLDAPAIVKADCIRARVHPDIDTKWVMYTLSAQQTRRYVSSRIHGVGRPRLGLGEIRKIPIPVPPLGEQHRIVTALEGHLSRLDVAEALIGRIELQSRLLASRVRDESAEHLKSTVRPLASLLSEPLANGRSVPTDKQGFPVLRLTAIRDGHLELAERKCGRWSEAEATPFKVQKGDFFVSRGNGSLRLVGRGALLEDEPDPVAFPDTMIRIRLDRRRMLPSFLRLMWDSRQVRSQIEGAARTTAGIYKINQKIVEDVLIPAPEVVEQERVISELEETLTNTAQGTSTTREAKLRAVRLRRSLLAEVFSGRLAQQDSHDESATVLLERIRVERSAQPRARRTRKIDPRQGTLL